MKKLIFLATLILSLLACAVTKPVQPTQVTPEMTECRETAHLVHRQMAMCRNAHVYDNNSFISRAPGWFLNFSGIDNLGEVGEYRYCRELEQHLYMRCMAWKTIKEHDELVREYERLKVELEKRDPPE